MSTFEKVKVVMLSTNEPSKIGNLATYQKRSLAKVIIEEINPIGSTLQFWNLHIISDDEIKEDDWCIDSNRNIFQHKNHFPISIGQRKIIATTDTSLDLPQPSKQFIEKYIEEYNKGNVIEDVLVEYELVSNEEYFLNTINPDDDVPYFDENLKINSKDNTITIKKVKDSWKKDDEELIKAFENFACAVYDENYNKDTSFKKRAELMSKKWIEENL